MRLVAIESPYAGDVERNLRYLDAAMADCFRRGEAPYASHGLYPRVLRDGDPDERSRGIEAGLLWTAKADVVAAYADLGVTPGMQLGIRRALARGQTVVYRYLPGWEGGVESRGQVA